MRRKEMEEEIRRGEKGRMEREKGKGNGGYRKEREKEKEKETERWVRK